MSFRSLIHPARRALSVLVLATGLGQAQPASPATLSPADYRADLAQLRRVLDEVEKAWPPGAKAVALRRLDALAVAADTLQLAWFHLETARIVALADNGHSVVPAGSRSAAFSRVPLRLAPFETAFHVVRARPDLADLLGARLVAIDGHDVSVVRDTGRTLNGGSAAWRDRFVPFFLESPEQLAAFGLAAARDAATYRFTLVDGRTVERRITADPADASRAPVGSHRWLFPEPKVAEADAWTPLLAPGAAPWALQDYGPPYRWRAAPEIDALVVELRATMNVGGQRIRDFLDTMTTTIRARAPRHLVLDLRMNGGGDLTTARAFVQSLPALVPGRIFVLTSPYTFSAAISTVAYLKQAAPARVTIVGEMLGDRLEFWAEGRPVVLAKSGIRVGVATERHDYADGCRRFTDCHGNVVRHPIAVPTLEPEIVAPWTADHYRAGTDPGMAAVAAALSQRSVP